MAPSTFSHEFQSAVAPAKLWAALKDRHGVLLKAMKPVVVSVEDVVGGGESPAVGDIKIMHMNSELAPFKFVKDKLTLLDESSLTIGSTVLEGGWLGIEVSSYSVTGTIKAGEKGGSVVSWLLEYEPLEDKPADVQKILQGVASSVKAVEAYLISDAS